MTPYRLTWQDTRADRLLADESTQAQWDALNARRANLPFLAGYAVAAALRAFGRGDERLLVGRRGDAVAAMFILQRAGAGRWSTFQPSQLPLGSWVAAPDLDLVTLARQLVSGPLGMSLVLSITQVDPLFAPRGPEGPSWCFSDYIETGWIDIDGSFDTYWAARGKNLRSNMRKQRNKLAAEQVDAKMVEWHTPESIAPALARYGQLESAGWKGNEGTAIHPENVQGRFYRELLEQAATRGEARIYEYLFDGRVVASNLCVQRAGTLVVLKTTYDEAIEKTLSPAFLLRQDQLHRLFIDRDCSRFEYYGRFRQWHSQWTERKRPLHHLTVYRWPLLRKLTARRRHDGQAEPAASQS